MAEDSQFGSQPDPEEDYLLPTAPQLRYPPRATESRDAKRSYGEAFNGESPQHESDYNRAQSKQTRNESAFRLLDSQPSAAEPIHDAHRRPPIPAEARQRPPASGVAVRLYSERRLDDDSARQMWKFCQPTPKPTPSGLDDIHKQHLVRLKAAGHLKEYQRREKKRRNSDSVTMIQAFANEHRYAEAAAVLREIDTADLEEVVAGIGEVVMAAIRDHMQPIAQAVRIDVAVSALESIEFQARVPCNGAGPPMTLPTERREDLRSSSPMDWSQSEAGDSSPEPAQDASSQTGIIEEAELDDSHKQSRVHFVGEDRNGPRADAERDDAEMQDDDDYLEESMPQAYGGQSYSQDIGPDSSPPIFDQPPLSEADEPHLEEAHQSLGYLQPGYRPPDSSSPHPEPFQDEPITGTRPDRSPRDLDVAVQDAPRVDDGLAEQQMQDVSLGEDKNPEEVYEDEDEDMVDVPQSANEGPNGAPAESEPALVKGSIQLSQYRGSVSPEMLLRNRRREIFAGIRDESTKDLEDARMPQCSPAAESSPSQFQHQDDRNELFDRFRDAYDDFVGSRSDFEELHELLLRCGSTLEESIWDEFVVTVCKHRRNGVAGSYSDPFGAYLELPGGDAYSRRILTGGRDVGHLRHTDVDPSEQDDSTGRLLREKARADKFGPVELQGTQGPASAQAPNSSMTSSSAKTGSVAEPSQGPASSAPAASPNVRAPVIHIEPDSPAFASGQQVRASMDEGFSHETPLKPVSNQTYSQVQQTPSISTGSAPSTQASKIQHSSSASVPQSVNAESALPSVHSTASSREAAVSSSLPATQQPQQSVNGTQPRATPGNSAPSNPPTPSSGSRRKLPWTINQPTESSRASLTSGSAENARPEPQSQSGNSHQLTAASSGGPEQDFATAPSNPLPAASSSVARRSLPWMTSQAPARVTPFPQNMPNQAPEPAPQPPNPTPRGPTPSPLATQAILPSANRPVDPPPPSTNIPPPSAPASTNMPPPSAPASASRPAQQTSTTPSSSRRSTSSRRRSSRYTGPKVCGFVSGLPPGYDPAWATVHAPNTGMYADQTRNDGEQREMDVDVLLWEA